MLVVVAAVLVTIDVAFTVTTSLDNFQLLADG